jgi:hypothetical protein
MKGHMHCSRSLTQAEASHMNAEATGKQHPFELALDLLTGKTLC